jgi:hypothetical protein
MPRRGSHPVEGPKSKGFDRKASSGTKPWGVTKRVKAAREPIAGEAQNASGPGTAVVAGIVLCGEPALLGRAGFFADRKLLRPHGLAAALRHLGPGRFQLFFLPAGFAFEFALVSHDPSLMHSE